MLIHVHESRPDGTPGKLFSVIDREPRRKKNTIQEWITYDGEDFPVLTGAFGNFILVSAERLAGNAKVMSNYQYPRGKK